MRSINIERGNVRGTQFTFDKGEGLPEHDHDETTAHMIFMQAGSVKLTVKGHDPITLVPPNIYDLAPNSPHAIEALENGTVIWNPIK